jgi:hypothetical protein
MEESNIRKLSLFRLPVCWKDDHHQMESILVGVAVAITYLSRIMKAHGT